MAQFYGADAPDGQAARRALSCPSFCIVIRGANSQNGGSAFPICSWTVMAWVPRYSRVCSALKSLAKIKDRITQLTVRDRTGIPLENVVSKLNATLRGWVLYTKQRS